MMLIKIGGGKQLNLAAIAADIATLIERGEQVIVVHGASARRDDLSARLGIPTQTITSPSGVTSVYTDAAAMEVFLMAYAGVVNKTIVTNLQQHGVNALGLSGVDGRLWQAIKKSAVYAVTNGKTKLITDNLTGKVHTINIELIQLLLNNGYTPVICPPALSEANEMVNTDNDFATAVMVEALQIKTMVVLFEAPGLLRDVHDETSIIPQINHTELESYLPYAVGRMKKKLLGTQQAFAAGLETMYWGDGRVAQPILNALASSGTVIT